MVEIPPGSGYYWLKQQGSLGPCWSVVWYRAGVKDGVGLFDTFGESKVRKTDDPRILEWGPRITRPEA